MDLSVVDLAFRHTPATLDGLRHRFVGRMVERLSSGPYDIEEERERCQALNEHENSQDP